MIGVDNHVLEDGEFVVIYIEIDGYVFAHRLYKAVINNFFMAAQFVENEKDSTSLAHFRGFYIMTFSVNGFDNIFFFQYIIRFFHCFFGNIMRSEERRVGIWGVTL